MIIEKLSSLTVKVSLTQEDMANHNVCFEYIQKDNINTAKLISYIVHEIKENLGIDLYSENLYIEAFSCTNNNCILYISAIDKTDDISDPSVLPPDFIILETNSAKNIIRFSVELMKYFYEYHKSSSLYHNRNIFRMILDTTDDYNGSIIETAVANNLKYYTDDLTLAHTKEYFKCVLSNNAVKNLSGNKSF